jgi:hypothetical protein
MNEVKTRISQNICLIKKMARLPLVYQTDNVNFSIAIRFAGKWHRTATHKESLSVRCESPRSTGLKLAASNTLVKKLFKPAPIIKWKQP